LRTRGIFDVSCKFISVRGSKITSSIPKDHGGAGFGRAWEWGDNDGADLSLPGVDDGALSPSDMLVVPVSCFRIDRLAYAP